MKQVLLIYVVIDEDRMKEDIKEIENVWHNNTFIN